MHERAGAVIARHRLLVELAILAALILVLTVLGPFGSYATPIGWRLLHWALYLATGYAFFRPVIAAGGALARQTRLPRPVAIAAACAFGAFPTSMVIVFVSAGPAWRMVTGATLASAYFQTLIIGGTVTIVQVLAGRGAPLPEVATAPARGSVDTFGPVDLAEAMPAPALLDQLPPHLHGPILCLENEDHYVRVHTAYGNALLLMRMRDAVAQLEGRGERVHRGWWVARDAVAGAVRQDRNWKLRLTNGREVPVARANVPALRAAGWLADEPLGG